MIIFSLERILLAIDLLVFQLFVLIVSLQGVLELAKEQQKLLVIDAVEYTVSIHLCSKLLNHQPWISIML